VIITLKGAVFPAIVSNGLVISAFCTCQAQGKLVPHFPDLQLGDSGTLSPITRATTLWGVKCTCSVMSLADIPQNHIRRNGQPSQSSVTLRESKLHSGSPNGDKNAEILRKPSSIQSMLRNTTETGDVGQFSIKPPRVTTSSPRLSPGSNKTRVTPSKHRHPVPYYNGHPGHNGQHGPGSPRQGSIASNGSGFHSQGRHGSHRMPSFEDYPPYVMTQGAYNNNDLNGRHPYTNGHDRSRAAVHNNRPHPPFAYPTRLKRPGYRPSSPAFSELNKSMAGYSQGPVHDTSSRTASPSSAYNMNRTPSPFRYVVDRSDPNLQYYPPYLGAEPRRNRSPSMSSTRPSTPKPSASLRSKASSTRLRRKKSVTNGTWLHPQTSPISPVFYDYTEEFEDQDNVANTSIFSRMPPEQPVPHIDSSTYSELGESPDSTSIAELPSDISPRKTKSQQYDSIFNQSTLEIDMVGDDFTQTAPQDLSDVPELPEKEMAATAAELPLKNPQHRWYEKSVHRSLPKSTSLPNVEAVQRLLPEDLIRESPQELAAGPIAFGVLRTSNQDLNSPVGSMFSAKSSVPPEPKLATPFLDHSPGATLSLQVRPETPINDFHQGHAPVRVDRAHPLGSSRGPSFEGSSRVSTEILSPTPERSIISPSSRDRFSKILSIEEGPLGLDMLVPPVSRDERIDSPMQGTHSSHIGQASTARPLWRNGSLYLRNSPLKQSVASNALVVQSDSDSSEEEPELTVALRQTFCKGDDDTLQQCTISSPITLPSQLAGRRFSPSVTVQRSPAIRRSITGLPAQPNEPYRVFEGDLKYAQPSFTEMVPAAPLKRPPAVDKELPQLPRKQVSMKSFSPAFEPDSSELPFDFVPLILRPSEDDSTAKPEVSPDPSLQEKTSIPGEEVDQMLEYIPVSRTSGKNVETNEMPYEDGVNRITLFNREVQNKRDSATSPHTSVGSRPGSRPWNLDSSYPWNDQLPELEVTIPQPAIESQQPAEKAPRFKLKIHRASSSTGGANKLKKELLPSEFAGTPFSSSHDLIHGPAFRRKRNPNLSVCPGDINSSHDIIQSSRQKTRFVETFDTQSPTISLQPPSPGYEVRSFFSDDSSQMRTKPSLIKRFSGYRARSAAARATSVDETRRYDRGLLSPTLGRSRASGRSSRQSRNTGRSSRQSQYTAGPSLRSSHARRARWKMVEKIKMWLQRGEGKVRGLGWRMGHRRGNNRSASTPLYAGV